MRLRQSPRLKDFHYTGSFAYNLTFVTRGRRPVFKDREAVEPCLDALKIACQRHGFDALAYCFMPDHLHVFVAAGQEGSSLRDFARYFKQMSGYQFRQRSGASLWQISYYDHVVRREESVQKIAAYIWDNPVRASLTKDRLDYAFSGPRELM